LVAECDPPEVQVNLLKGLPGTRLARDAAALGLAFNPEPPYELLRSDAMDFATLTRIGRFARCWELVHNRGHFPQEVRALHAATGDLYSLYLSLAGRIHAAEGKLFAISRPRLAALLNDFLASQSSEALAKPLCAKAAEDCGPTQTRETRGRAAVPCRRRDGFARDSSVSIRANP
jgi:hypothetical protein